MQQFQHFLVLLLPLFFHLITSDALKGYKHGVWYPIRNINDPYVTQLAEFAVYEYNIQSNASLTLVVVESGDTRVASGVNFRLLLKATDGTLTKDYRAVVWENVLTDSRKLILFQAI
ncbi:hypothetical protein V6N13_132257 [Hibiscus sabdariffa]|uniref:Cystatin domain-containing protein n=1 Tax=Hibiscus sabdariffa TaxID=183260 RepID=A0ABR2PUQ4_9ROSI